MPLDCLPEHLLDVENHFEDDKQYLGIPILGKLYYWWEKKTKGWFAVGNAANRSKYSWCNWRQYPVVLWTTGDCFEWRFENDAKDAYWFESKILQPGWYLSRVQYAKEWHIALQWPLFLHGHYKNCQFYAGLKRDADKVYWLSLYLGKVWK